MMYFLLLFINVIFKSYYTAFNSFLVFLYIITSEEKFLISINKDMYRSDPPEVFSLVC